MADKRDLRRRLLGAIFLIAALVLLIAGETLLSERLRARPAQFLIFWLACFICVGLAIMMAALDLVVMRRRARDEQRRLIEETVAQIARAKTGSPERRPPQNSGNSRAK